jgi:hypothetical protein
MAHGRAHRVIALPSALRMAVALDLGHRSEEVALGHDRREGQRGEQHEEEGGSHL